ncbi:MAG: PilZ domain-containing protein, partial [Myxococcota bacterium]
MSSKSRMQRPRSRASRFSRRASASGPASAFLASSRRMGRQRDITRGKGEARRRSTVSKRMPRSRRHRLRYADAVSDAAHFRSGGRRALSLRVRFTVDGTFLTHDATTADVSMGGAYVETTRPPAPGELVRLELLSPTAWDPLVVPADVRWALAPVGAARRPPGFGARFGRLSPEQAAALYELLRATGYLDDAEAA